MSSPPAVPSAARSSSVDDAGEAVECLDERTVGRPHDRVAGAVEDERAVGGRFAGELAHQAALAGPGLAADEDDAATFSLGDRVQVECFQFGGAPDERKRRLQA